MRPGTDKHSKLSANHESFQALVAHAESMERLDILESFRKDYIVACLVKNSNDMLATWEALEDAVDMDYTLREAERTMNQSLFVNILKSSGMMVSGTDQTGRNILWLQTPGNLYSVTANSPEAGAFIRAMVWSTEIASLKSHTGCLVIIDDSSRSLLDFNLPLAKEIGMSILRRTPAENNSIILFGAHRVLRPAWNMFAKMGVSFTSKIRFVKNTEEIYCTVKNPEDIPDWWLGKGKGKKSLLCRNNLWEWERCLGKGETTVRAKEIFNPMQPWEDIDEEVIEDAETTVHDAQVQALDTILEEEADDSPSPYE
jgi:hypothetical protein